MSKFYGGFVIPLPGLHQLFAPGPPQGRTLGQRPDRSRSGTDVGSESDRWIRVLSGDPEIYHKRPRIPSFPHARRDAAAMVESGDWIRRCIGQADTPRDARRPADGIIGGVQAIRLREDLADAATQISVGHIARLVDATSHRCYVGVH